MDIKIFFNCVQLFLDDADLPNVKMHFQSYGSPLPEAALRKPLPPSHPPAPSDPVPLRDSRSDIHPGVLRHRS